MIGLAIGSLLAIGSSASVFESVQLNGLCMDINSHKDLYVLTCNAGRGDKQLWSFESDGTVKNAAFPDLCVTADRYKWPKLRTCNEGDDEQQWAVIADAMTTGVDNDYCLYVHSNGKRLIVGECGNFVWDVVANDVATFGPGTVEYGDGLCMDLDAHKDLYLKPCTESRADKQTWTLQSDGIVRNAEFPDLCLTADRFKWPKLRACNEGDDEQQWELDDGALCVQDSDSCLIHVDGGNRLIVDADSSIVFTIDQPLFAAETIMMNDQCVGIDAHKDLYLYDCDGADKQLWTMNSDGMIKNAQYMDLCLIADGLKWPKLKDCVGAEEQIWTLVGNGIDSPLYSLAVDAGYCLVKNDENNRLLVEKCMTAPWNIGA